jgi:DNA-binding CsgD family transcriptional regulator
MSPAEILADLEARVGALGGGSRLSPARHKTVRAAVEWSYELLDRTEQRALRSLAVFVGGFDSGAAMAIVPGLTVDAVARLVDKSVVASGKTSRGTTRYRLLETVREHAHERLVASGELEGARERHLHHPELEEVELEGFATFVRGLMQALSMAVDAARADLDAAIALLRRADSRVGEGMALATLGLTFLITDEPARARELLEQAVAIQTAAGYPWGEGQARLYLATTIETTDQQAAALHYRRAIGCLQHYRDTNLLANALIGQAGLIARRDPAVALRVAAAAVSVRVRVHGNFPGFFGEQMRRIRAGCEAALGTDADRIWAEGSRLGIDEAVALAFGASRPRAPAPAGLSARELEVVRLVAEGLANKAIATQLHLSVRTVESHVRHMLAKAGLSNRTQLARWAREHNQ